MARKAKFTAIVLAAGSGKRMQLETPKQYMEIDGYPLLFYSLYAFAQSAVDEIVLVTRREDEEYCKSLIVRYHIAKIKCVIAGGTERCWSVRNGLAACTDTDYVLIHDAARPCITVERIEFCMREVVKTGACSLGVPVKDTIKVVDENGVGIDTPPRRSLWQVQTPQCFLYADLREAYDGLTTENAVDITDDTMILERYLHKKTRLIPGDYTNIKVTTPDDILTASIFLKKNKKVVDTE